MDHTADPIQIATEGVKLAHQTGLLRWITSRIKLGRRNDDTDYQTEAVKVLRENALDTLSTLELAVSDASRILSPGFTLDDLDKVNATWQRSWTNRVSNVDAEDEERRQWWARLLAGEIEHPGRFSLRTLAVMDTLSMEEARWFTDHCQYVFLCTSGLLMQAGMNDEMVSATLRTDDWSTGRPTLVIPDDINRLNGTMSLVGMGLMSRDPYGFNANNGTGTDTHPCKFAVMQYDTHRVAVLNHDNDFQAVSLGRFWLSDIGCEIYRLTEPVRPEEHYQAAINMWRSSHRVVEF